MTGFFTSPRIAWGPGALEQLSGLGARRAAVVVDPVVFAQKGHLRIVEELGKSETVVEVIAGSPEADRLDHATELGRRLTDFAPDWIVAIGGGRTLDGTKAARLLLERPDLTLGSLPPVLELPDSPRSRLVAVPTTSGSGSEASWSVDLRAEDGTPLELAHRALTPDWAIVDAGFAQALPYETRRDGAVEALAQAVESYLSAWANPFSDALAVATVRTVVERLPHALRWSDDPDAKEALHGAATLSGLAASNAQRGVAHALAHALVGPTGLPYGRLLGILLPRTLEFDRPSARDRIESLGLTLQTSEDRSPVPLEIRLARLYELLRIPSSLAGAGVERSRVESVRDAVVTNALRSPAILANPRVPGARELQSLLAAAIDGSVYSP